MHGIKKCGLTDLAMKHIMVGLAISRETRKSLNRSPICNEIDQGTGDMHGNKDENPHIKLTYKHVDGKEP